MSWNNVIPAEFLLGEVELTPKEVENPEVTIPDELVTDCLIKYKIGDYGITSNADHPAFAELRKVLNGRGYIEIPPYACWNGDRVKKRFVFNGFQLEVGDTFYCAGAWSTKMKVNTLPDMITREEADARVAAALREAAEDVRQWGSLLCGVEDVTDEVASDILDLIPDAGGALDRAIAEAVQAEREACAMVAFDLFCGAGEPGTAAIVSDAIRARTEGEG